MTRLSEQVHEWMGWCPDQRIVARRRDPVPWPDKINSHSLQKNGSYVNNGVIADYGKTGISVRYFFGAVIGIVGIIMVLFLIARAGSLPLAGVPFFGLILLVVFVMVYQDLKKTSLEITQDTLIIRRSLNRPVIIPKNTISTVEIRHNSPPIPLWLLKLLFLVIAPASSVVALYGEYLRFTAGQISSMSLFLHLGFFISIILLFLASYYHSRIRADYPETLTITTNRQELAGFYGDHLSEIAQLLGKSA